VALGDAAVNSGVEVDTRLRVTVESALGYYARFFTACRRCMVSFDAYAPLSKANMIDLGISQCGITSVRRGWKPDDGVFSRVRKVMDSVEDADWDALCFLGIQMDSMSSM